MILSVCASTRHRVPHLRQMVRSVFASVADVEVVLRVHDDDPETLAAVEEMAVKEPRIRYFQGRHLGYLGNPVYGWELAHAAQGEWLLGLDDDAELVAEPGWEKGLLELPLESWVEPKRYQHGEFYDCDLPVVPFFALRNKWWLRMGLTHFESPTDVTIHTLLVQRNWRRHILPFAIVHHRLNDEATRDA